MKKSLFERIVYDVPEFLIASIVYIVGGGALLLLMFGLPGCTIHEPLPGLCYTDKTGTYLCPEEENLKVKNTKDNVSWKEARDFAHEQCRIFIGDEFWTLCYDNFMKDEYSRRQSGD